MSEKKHSTVGVAGHVDHGKTALVRALSGTETDRLQEEKQRGMSIVLGFAHLTFPQGEVDLIDVPGHEKFLRTMISGATGLDAALLTIAANERVKPQTAEHLALLELLGVRRGLVVVTKADLVLGEGDRGRVAVEVREFLRGSFLHDAALLWTSTLTGEGVAEVKTALETLLCETVYAPVRPYFNLPIDRVFTMTGHGTVVTGTLRTGLLTLGQTVEIWPGGRRAEVRGLEVHGQAVEAARPGWRTAVNLRGVRKDDLRRGDVLATPGAFRPTRLVDVELTVPTGAETPVKRGQSVLLYHGTAEMPVRVYPLGTDEVAPGTTTFAQLRLAGDAVVPAGERFVLRSTSGAQTVGGGVVFDPYPEKHTRIDDALQRRMRRLSRGSDPEKVAEKLREAGAEGCSPTQLTIDLGLAAGPVLFGISCGADLALHPEVFDALAQQILEAVLRYHRTQPLLRGMLQEELRRGLPRALKPAAYHTLLESLVGAKQIETIHGLVRAPDYSPEAALSPVERAITLEIEAQFLLGGLKPSALEEVVRKDRRRRRLVQFLLETEVLVTAEERASGCTVVFHRDALASGVEHLRQALCLGQGCTVSEINTLLGTTRKFSVPLLEYLDKLGITRREGDLRFWNGENSGNV